MTIFEMLGQSGLLTVLGMLVVFSFIIVLIICMHIMHFFVAKYVKIEKAEPKKAQKVAAKPTVSAYAADEKEIVAAIAAAIYEREI